MAKVRNSLIYNATVHVKSWQEHLAGIFNLKKKIRDICWKKIRPVGGKAEMDGAVNELNHGCNQESS